MEERERSSGAMDGMETARRDEVGTGTRWRRRRASPAGCCGGAQRRWTMREIG